MLVFKKPSFAIQSIGAAGVAALLSCAPDTMNDLQARLETRIAEADVEVVAVNFHDLATGASLLIEPDTRVHAASMMKVPVMVQLYRDHEAGLISLDDSVTITKTFRSIVDGSSYQLGAPDDSDTTLYTRVGEEESIRQLMELMITVSSNLATNMLIELVGAERVRETTLELGADSMQVLRGVEDILAYRAGLSNTTTARDEGIVYRAIAEGSVASPESCDEMMSVLLRQAFDEGIPAGLPGSARVAHKTGWVPGLVRHDGGIVMLEGGERYVLVVLTKSELDSDTVDTLIVDISRMVHEHVVGS
jgi:beta-lactamase class A